MLGLVAAAMLTLSTPAAMDCAAEARVECIELMQALYRSANPETGEAVGLRADRYRAEPVRLFVRPHSLARQGGERILIVSVSTLEGLHVEVGSWSLYVFDADTPTLRRRQLHFRYSGSFGQPGSGRLVELVDNTLALVVESGGTWQGHSCVWSSVDLIESGRARALLEPVLLVFDDASGIGPRRASIAGGFESLTSRSAVLVYDDGQRFSFTSRNGQLRTNRATPQRC